MNPLQTVLDSHSIALRRKIVETIKGGGRGHLASALSLVEILRVLYDDVLNCTPANRTSPERDRFILSKGHGCLALYVILAEKKFFDESELARFCHKDGLLGGHPEHRIPGVEASTGSLGHGMSIAVGLALSARLDKSTRRVITVIGDGESNEGSIWEAALCAGKHRLSNLTVLVDYNKQQSYGSTTVVQDLEPLAAKWDAFNFHVEEVDGHDLEALRRVLKPRSLDPSKPGLVICHTVKGKGIAFAENDMKFHHLNKVTEQDLDQLLTALGGL